MNNEIKSKDWHGQSRYKIKLNKKIIPTRINYKTVKKNNNEIPIIVKEVPREKIVKKVEKKAVSHNTSIIDTPAGIPPAKPVAYNSISEFPFFRKKENFVIEDKDWINWTNDIIDSFLQERKKITLKGIIYYLRYFLEINSLEYIRVKKLIKDNLN